MVIVLFLGACLYGFSLLTADESYVTCFDTPYPAYEGVEHNAHFKFPPSAQNIEFDAKSENRSCVIWVSFEMAPDELETFAASTFVTSLKSSILVDIDFIKDLRHPEWRFPHYGLIGSERTDHNGTYIQQWVIIHDTHPDLYTVYVTVMKS